MIRRGAALARSAWSDKLLRVSSWLFVGFLVSGFFNYAFQIAMGRLLSPVEFGLLNALLGLSVVLSVPVSTLFMVLSKKTAECRAAQNLARVRQLFQRANRFILTAGAVGLALFMASSGLIADYVRVPSLAPVFILGFCIVSSIAMPVNTAILQGLQDYAWFGVIQGLAGPLKFVFCAVLVFVGLGVNGALLGILAANATLWAMAFISLRRHFRSASEPSVPFSDSLAARQAVPVFLADLAFVLMTQMDLILVNRYFSGEEAAMYASAAVLGRTVMYIPGTLVLAMFPMASEQHALNVDSSPLLFKSLAMTLLLSGLGALIFFLAPEWTMTLLFGSRYAGAAGLLKYFGVAMLPMALLMVLFHYLIARGKAGFSYLMLAGAILQILLLHFFHASLMSVILIVAATGFLTFWIGMIQAWMARPSSSGAYTYECA